MTRPDTLQVDLRQLILALETTVDLVGMNDTHHGKRVGYIASQLLLRMGAHEDDVHCAFELGLLHDCGVSTEQMHTNLVNHFDWEDSDLHCEIGYRLLVDFDPLGAYALPILYHHTPWAELERLELDGTVAFMANLIFLADRIDVMAVPHYDGDILIARHGIVRAIEGYRDSHFKPELVDAFLELADSESFWISLEDRHITRYTWDMGQFRSPQAVSTAELRQFALIMAYIVDQKSPFTARHSARVGALARFLAQRHGLDAQRCDKLEIAGHLHDLGKLRIPDHILEKPGPLTEGERAIMKQHSYETFEILRHIRGIEDIARWAAYHHEGLDGTGYPFHPGAAALSIEARILAVADIFQALVQDRPYRAGLPLEQVLRILDEETAGGRLDGEITALAKRHADSCFEIAQGRDDDHRLEGAIALASAVA